MRPIKTDNNFRFSRYTTYGLGGGAQAAYFPETREDAFEVYDFVKKNYGKFFVLGNGSDVLASSTGFDGAVICTKFLSGISYENGYLCCLSGTTVSTLLNFCLEKGLSGLEYLTGIPASVGGLAFMNGGINARHLGDDIAQVEFYDGKLHNFSNKECNFANKHSTMRDINGIITSVKLRIEQSTRDAVEKNMDYFMLFRRMQPKGKSCGCVFKNPEGSAFGAGKLIDESGLKGLKLGCAEVSREHANFIINRGSNSDDVFNLIKEVKSRVKAFCGVELDEEVVYIGEFNDFDG